MQSHQNAKTLHKQYSNTNTSPLTCDYYIVILSMCTPLQSHQDS